LAGEQAVSAIDLYMDNKFYEKTIEEGLDINDQKYFLATHSNKIMIAKDKGNSTKMLSVAEYIIPNNTVASYEETEVLRAEF